MSGAKNFGVRSPPDPAVVGVPLPPTPAPPAPMAPVGGCCCRCRCRCPPPPPPPPPSIPAQLLAPFPEPPVLRLPHRPPARTAELPAVSADVPGSSQTPTCDPDLPSASDPSRGSATGVAGIGVSSVGCSQRQAAVGQQRCPGTCNRDEPAHYFFINNPHYFFLFASISCRVTSLFHFFFL